MTKKKGFDFPAAVRKLAEAERPHKSVPDFANDPPGSIGTQSMEAVFPALRVKGLCPDECNCEPESHTGRGWVPEPDVRVACWEIMSYYWNRPFGVVDWIEAIDNIQEEQDCSFEEAVLRAAEAGLEAML